MSNNNNPKNIFVHFWRSNDNKISIIRDVFIALLIVFIILLALWTYTGQWFSAPMVAIESGSMMHDDEPFGRVGTIDAGDMVLLVKIDNREDIATFAEKDSDNFHYGKYGDVVIYRPNGNQDVDQIIHRAMCWVEVKGTGSKKTYTIEEYDIIDRDASDPLLCEQCGIMANGNPVKVDWDNSGFITKGDNNYNCDQVGFPYQPVKTEWITGKARGELPWIGTINLIFNDLVGGKDTVKNVKDDSMDCLVILIEFLILIPIGLDFKTYYSDRKKQLKINNSKSNLTEVLVYYWFAFAILFAVLYFLINTHIGAFLQLILCLIVDIAFLFLIKVEGEMLKIKDLQLWLLVCFLTGPIGLTILYYKQSNKSIRT